LFSRYSLKDHKFSSYSYRFIYRVHSSPSLKRDTIEKIIEITQNIEAID
jgi:hypothetical protein